MEMASVAISSAKVCETVCGILWSGLEDGSWLLNENMGCGGYCEYGGNQTNKLTAGIGEIQD